MPEIKINNISIKVEENNTVLDAAKKLNIHIPTMCRLEDFKPSTSCMVCVVKNKNTNSIIPACSALVEDGMDIITDSEEINNLRRNALELLLSEHSGDCDALCQRVCPAGMDIPLMNRLIAQRKFDEALKVVKETIPIPGILGYICPAPCEKSCRRKDIDEPVSVCMLKRFVAEQNIQSENFFIPERKEFKNKNVAVIGSGPVGLTSAYYLALDGYKCRVYDENELPGGKIRTEIPEDKLPKRVLDAEINIIKQTGVDFINNRKITISDIKQELADNNSIIIIAGGFSCDIDVSDLVKIDTPDLNDINIYRYNETIVVFPNIPVKKSKSAVRSVRTGLRLVASIQQLFNNETVTAIPKRFNSVYAKIEEIEKAEFLKDSENHNKRIEPKDFISGFDIEQAVKEAKRCLHCDCREKTNCSLRNLSDTFNAKQNTYVLTDRKYVEKINQHNIIIYEPMKCIKCGICIQTTEKIGEDIGFTYIGRGFNVKIGFPLNNTIENALKKTAEECAKNCPTGAIALI